MRRLLPLAVSLALAQAAAASGNEGPPAFEPAIVELRVNGQDDGPTLIVRRDRDGALLRLRLARPKANICDAAMIGALQAALDAHRGTRGLRGVLLDAEGPHFSFGASVEEHLADRCAAMLASLHTLILALVVVLVGALLLYRNWQQEREFTKAEPGSAAGLPGSGTAPAFSLKDTNGNIYSSAQLAGKPAAINFFATWCPPCREEIPGFVEVYNKHKEKGFELIGISLDTDTRGNLPGFLMSNKIGYKILFGDLATARAYGGVSALPTTFFVGKDGEIKNVHVGYMDKDAFDKEVRKLL